MHIKYSSFHRQFFQVITIVPRLNHLEYWLIGSHTHLVVITKGRALQDSKDVSYNRTESSGTSGRQLKLINYQLLVLPNQTSHCIPL